jgi:hypothetical protein
VSIKNKLVTAVTTAGLLAGLFGSAFVPAARAAIAEGVADYTVTCTGEDTNSESGLPTAVELGDAVTDTDGTCNFLATVTPVVQVVLSKVDDVDDGDWTFTVDGTTIKSVSQGAADGEGGTVNSITVDPSDYLSATVNFTGDAGDDQGFTLNVTMNKLVAGKSATLTVTNSDDVDVIEVTVEAIAASLKNKVSATYSTLSIAIPGTSFIDDADIADDELYVMAEDIDAVGASTGEIQVDVETVYNADPATWPLITAEVSGDLLVAATTAATCNAVTSGEYEKTATALADGENTICLVTENGDETDAGAATLTITAGGVELADYDITILGYVTDIVATKGMQHFAVGGALDGSASLYPAKLTYKDSAGGNLNTLCAKAAEVCDIDTDYDDVVTWKLNPATGTFSTSARIDVGDAPNFGAGTSADGYVSYNDVCNGADSGDVHGIRGSYVNEADDTVTEEWTVVCTDNEGIITKIAGEAATAAPGAEVDVLYTITDSEGRACGYGCQVTSDGDITVTLQPATGAAASELRASDGTELVASDFDDAVVELTIVDGSGAVTVEMPTTAGNYAFVIDYADIGDGVKEGSWTVRFTVTNVAAAPASQNLTAGPKKLIATADFGYSAAGAKVAFTLERSNGTVKTYYRKANADGVAKFTLRFRGTYEVTASFGDYITDTVILKK